MLCKNVELPVNLNSRLQLLEPYPVEKLSSLFSGVTANPFMTPIDLSIGEPKHPAPDFINKILSTGMEGFSSYPTTTGCFSLRENITNWLSRRYQLKSLDPETQVLPTLGSREALFSLAQAVLDDTNGNGLVLCPNPFYQIYEGSALLAGAKPYFINTVPEEDFRLDWSSVPVQIWPRVQLVFVCSPNNPSGAVMSLDEWRELFRLSDKYGFIIAADECYSEIYFNEQEPPLGALQAAHQLGRDSFPRLVVLGSLSKRSNVPGMRSGFAVGDVKIIEQFTRYRTYHGSAMGGLIQHASSALWRDEEHVYSNRESYRKKFSLFKKIVNPVLPLNEPDASFYYWVKTPIDDQTFAVRLRREKNISVLPGSLLARDAHGLNPGRNFIRIALVSTIEETRNAAQRIREFVEK